MGGVQWILCCHGMLIKGVCICLLLSDFLLDLQTVCNLHDVQIVRHV